jgi:hypothetical protein
MSGKRHFMLIVDEATGFRWIRFVASVSDCTAAFRKFLHVICKQDQEHRVKVVRTDGGPDYASQFQVLLADKAITHEPIPAGSHQSNGMVEGSIGIVSKRIRTLLAWADLPPTFWAEAASHAVNMLNALPTKRAGNEWAPPYEHRTGRRPDLSVIAPFGCLAAV